MKFSVFALFAEHCYSLFADCFYIYPVPYSTWSQQSIHFALFFFAYYGFIGVFTPYAGLFFAEKGMSIAQIGVLMSLMQVMRIFGPNLWGWVADRSQKRVLVLRLTALAAALSFSGMFVGQTFTQYLAVMIFVSLRMQETPHAQAGRDTPSVRKLLRQREVIAFFASTFLMIAAHSALYVYFSLYLAQIGYSKIVIGMMWSLGVIAEIVFFFYQGPIFRRYGVRHLMIASLLIAVVRFAMIGYLAQSLLWLLIAQLLHAVTFGTHHSASVATLQKWFSGPLQARGQALFISISYGLGGSFGGLVLGSIWDRFGAQLVYMVAACFALGGAGAAWLSYRWQLQHHEEKKWERRSCIA